MASQSGNPNQFDMQKLFKPPNLTPNPGTNPNSNAPFLPPASYAAGASHLPYPAMPSQGTFIYPHTPPFHPHPFMNYPQEILHRPIVSFPVQPSHLPNPSSSPNSATQNPGARLMALLGNTPPAQFDFTSSMPPVSSSAELPAILHSAPSAPPTVMAVTQAQPTRMQNAKMPTGWHLERGEQAVHDVDSRLPGETHLPQLEVTPITKYTSDPGLVLGRQIAVNRTYICYGLKLGAIRVLNINTALRSLLRGHSQRVTDMAFFAEEIHLLASVSVDGKVYVWKINEGPDHEDKPQITGKLVLAIQFIGDRDYHPKICWHSHKEEKLVIGIGNNVLRIDIPKVVRGTEYSADEPLKCPLEQLVCGVQLVDGVQLVGRHDAEVTDLSIPQWMTTRFASASNDGTILKPVVRARDTFLSHVSAEDDFDLTIQLVKIWDDHETLPLLVLRPHEGQPVHSVSFLTSPHRPDHMVLLTSGPLNREVKLWSSTAEEGWLLPSDSETWRCNQTLELRSSREPRVDEAFFNQVVVLPQDCLVLLANAKKNAIYAIHIDYGPYPAATCIDYIADFTVTMPILSLTGTSDIFPDGEHVVQVYCVQTQAIQQYALSLAQCLPPAVDNLLLAKDPCISHIYDGVASEEISASELSHSGLHDISSAGVLPIHSVGANNSGNPIDLHSALISSESNNIPGLPPSSIDIQPSAPPLPIIGRENLNSTSSLGPLDLDMSGKFSGFQNALKVLDGQSLGDRGVYLGVSDYQTERGEHNTPGNNPNTSFMNDNTGKDNLITGPSDGAMILNSQLMVKLDEKTTHLVTPLEIFSGVKSSSETSSVNQRSDEVKVLDLVGNSDLQHLEVIKVVDVSVMDQSEDFISQSEANNVSNQSFDEPSSSQASNTRNLPKEVVVRSAGLYNANEVQVGDYVTAPDVVRSAGLVEEKFLKIPTDLTTDLFQDESAFVDIPTSKTANGKKQKAKQSHASGTSLPSVSQFNPINNSSNEPGFSMGVLPSEAVFSQFLSIQDLLNQILSMQIEMNRQISTAVNGLITKEGKRVEAALCRSMEKIMKANAEALWVRFLEENARRDKAENDHLQHISSLITNFINKDLAIVLERTLKKEIPLIGTAITRSISPVVEKTISSAIFDSFQRGVGDKAVNQLEKSVNSKLDGAVTRQIQAQFQSIGRQVLQDALRFNMESSLIPAFEKSCKLMFEQVDATFQKGMGEHQAAALQQFESSHTPLALTLRDAINSASSIAQNLTSEVAEGQRKVLAALVSGNTKPLNPMAMQQINGPLGSSFPEMMALSVQQVEAHHDPTKELSRLISELKYDEAFNTALQRSDVSIVSWLCSQVDIRGICSMVPLPLNQGVLLALLQQLACDIGNDTARKLAWMTDVAAAINPLDPIVSIHVQPIFEQVYGMLAHQRTLPSTSGSEASSIRLIMHVINSVLMTCK